MKKILSLLCLLIGFSLIFFAVPVLAADCPPGNPPQVPNTAICNPAPNFFVDLEGDVKEGNTFAGLMRFGINILLGIVGLISILFIVVGGYQYITSGANEELAETGK